MELETTDAITSSLKETTKTWERKLNWALCSMHIYCILATNDAYRSHREKIAELKNSFYTFWTQRPINKNKMKSHFIYITLAFWTFWALFKFSAVFLSPFNHDQFHALLYWNWWGLFYCLFLIQNTIQLHIYDSAFEQRTYLRSKPVHFNTHTHTNTQIYRSHCNSHVKKTVLEII